MGHVKKATQGVSYTTKENAQNASMDTILTKIGNVLLLFLTAWKSEPETTVKNANTDMISSKDLAKHPILSASSLLGMGAYPVRRAAILRMGDASKTTQLVEGTVEKAETSNAFNVLAVMSSLRMDKDA